MRKLLALFVIVAIVISVSAQNDTTKKHVAKEGDEEMFAPTEADRQIDIVNDPTVFFVVEVMPQFPGGQQELFNFLTKNINYPNKAKKEKIEGVVYVRFIVDKDGTIKGASVTKPLSQLLDEEALRVINKMPNWKPGMQNGIPVRVYYTIPIRFRL